MRVLLVIATVLAVFAIFAVWANRQLLSPDNWARTSTSLLQKETIRTALAGYLVDQLYANVDVPAQVKSGLPTQSSRSRVRYRAAFTTSPNRAPRRRSPFPGCRASGGRPTMRRTRPS